MSRTVSVHKNTINVMIDKLFGLAKPLGKRVSFIIEQKTKYSVNIHYRFL